MILNDEPWICIDQDDVAGTFACCHLNETYNDCLKKTSTVFKSFY